MIGITLIKEEEHFHSEKSKQVFISFLYRYLGEYKDSKEDIEKAVNYAFSKSDGKGGFLLEAYDDTQLIGGVVINNSGMSGYIPEHVLVYIAVQENRRGEGIGRMLLEKAITLCKGDVSLHVEYDNPAIRLYESVGFTSKYAEMRYEKES
jgi:GNAT superfamily N-acetyltransferase